jgi:hypothetical protein
MKEIEWEILEKIREYEWVTRGRGSFRMTKTQLSLGAGEAVFILYKGNAAPNLVKCS